MSSEPLVPTSAQPRASLTPEQRQKRYEELRKRMGRSRLEVEGDPNKHYFWADNSAQGRTEMVTLEGQGYSIVREPHPKEVLAGTRKPLIRANGLKEDGTYVIGDVILTEVDLDAYNFFMAENDRRSQESIKSVKDDFLIEAESVGAPTFETTGKGKRKE